jgi:feruloyl-CoA synthase
MRSMITGESTMSKPPFADLNFAPATVDRENLADGGMILRSPQALQPYPNSVVEMVHHWAATEPDRTFLAERDAQGGWRKLSYAKTAATINAIAQALLDRNQTAATPVMLLSDNGVDNALMQLAAMQIGVPAAPVSPAYSLMSQDHAKLKHIFGLIQPTLIYAIDGERFATALDALPLDGVEIVVSANPPAGRDCTLLSELAATIPTAAVSNAFDGVGPDTLAKILFTSGSTGLPKGVINTQRMLCSNQQAIKQIWPFLEESPPVVVDWLPWNHTFGGNHNFNMVLFNGGTLYVDNGKPVPGLIENTVQNLREVSPTIYFNVPRGFDVLIPFMEQDASLRDSFFRNLDLIFYAAAALPQNLWERLEKLSIASRGERVRMVSAWGSTETAPMVTSVHYTIERAGVIGLPAPGTELKMTPNGSKLELRVRGPNVTPGYYKNPELTAEAFDEDGFYCIGDAGRLADEDDPAKGVIFDGRVAEDFKLSSGTWVNVGMLRVAVVAAGAPVIQDAVIAGHDRDEIGLLVFPNPAGCKSLCPDAGDIGLDELMRRPEVIDALRRGLAAHNADNPGNSTRITRALMMSALPSIDANEITDKGYINQRAVLETRADLVTALFAGGDNVILID